MSEQNKRVVPPALRKILDYDEKLTNKFVNWANKFLPFRSLRIHYRALELTCHGVPWLAFWVAFTWLFNNQSLVQMQVNILLGLILDIVFVALIKAYVRRKRPKANIKDAVGEIGPDVFSFPSGHASRAAFIVYFFMNLFPLHFLFYPSLLAWAVSICLTRVLMNRHHILDVLAGVALGIMEGALIGLVLISEDTSKWLMNYLTDEKLDGGEYHV
ncbi:PAP2 superfamily [Popillia japonica]|uniref:PAP2 superfamily n=1 Tax=Popillia japonica TaxID=7064 RepID=A0AAW1N1Q2_POPJA